MPPTESGHQENIQTGYLGITPPQGPPPQRGQRIWVDRPEQLLQAVTVLKQAPVIAIDAEFAQNRSRAATLTVSSSSLRMALLQLAIEQRCFVVDTLRLHNLSPLKEVVENPAISILLHGASADLRVMAERNLDVAHYYDLEATSRSIFGQHESSLAAMLQRAFNVRLDKSLQRTDWTRRPLPPAMIAYAARDAEMTLALYHWLKQYYPEVLRIHEYTNLVELVAAWIEPFLQGTSPLSADMAVAEAKAKGELRDKAQMVEDCRAALSTLTTSMRRCRLLRLIADLSLKALVPEIKPLLQAPTSDERAASARALGRLKVKEASPWIEPLLQDPVYDVRKSAQTALRNLGNKKLKSQFPTPPPVKRTDGARSWTIGETSSSDDDDNDWKARLRSIMGE
ncbi:MAG: HEAT repeat domain-containing protein [Chloroflexota bacterium]|nr:HEAT repeat domain-containing protein [Chloroflexota bacterium]